MTDKVTTDDSSIDSAASALSAGLEGVLGWKALDILLVMARLAADGKSLTIAEDYGFGSATVIDQDGAHTHVGIDCLVGDAANFEAFVNQLHSLLIDKRGLAWLKPSNAIAQGREHSERPTGAEG
jgi:hypothetical protein